MSRFWQPLNQRDVARSSSTSAWIFAIFHTGRCLANTSGHTKKITVNAMVFLAYCVANILAPQTSRASEAPGYASGYNSILGFETSAMALMAVYYCGVKWENKRRDKEFGEDYAINLTMEESMDDLTD